MTVYIDKRYFNETSFKRDLFSTLLQEDLFSNQVLYIYTLYFALFLIHLVQCNPYVISDWRSLVSVHLRSA